jgi:hypothetical protein
VVIGGGEKYTYSLIILAPTPHDHVRWTSLGLFRLLMRLVGTESALCGTEEGRHCAGSVAGKERHAGRHQLVAGFSEEVRGLDVSVGGVLGSERSLGS